MNTRGIIGISLLGCLWVYLAYLLLATGGITLKNIIILAMTAVIIFVPLMKRLFNPKDTDKK